MIDPHVLKFLKTLKILFIDIETAPNFYASFRPGKQHITIEQLHPDFLEPQIICAAWKWLGRPTVYTETWETKWQKDHRGHHKVIHDSTRIVQQLDKMVEQADIIIGQNAKSFDFKWLNTVRMLKDLPPLPNWLTITQRDTLEMMKKHLYLPSNKLDYISRLLGLGGKLPTRWEHWISITLDRDDAQERMKEMLTYNKKDVKDNEAQFLKILPYCEMTVNANLWTGFEGCRQCGSTNVARNGIRHMGEASYQQLQCRDCHGYAGRVRILKDGKTSTRVMK